MKCPDCKDGKVDLLTGVVDCERCGGSGELSDGDTVYVQPGTRVVSSGSRSGQRKVVDADAAAKAMHEMAKVNPPLRYEMPDERDCGPTMPDPLTVTVESVDSLDEAEIQRIAEKWRSISIGLAVEHGRQSREVKELAEGLSKAASPLARFVKALKDMANGKHPAR